MNLTTMFGLMVVCAAALANAQPAPAASSGDVTITPCTPEEFQAIYETKVEALKQSILAMTSTSSSIAGKLETKKQSIASLKDEIKAKQAKLASCTTTTTTTTIPTTTTTTATTT